MPQIFIKRMIFCALARQNLNQLAKYYVSELGRLWLAESFDFV